jgi:hypothetical protein
VQQMELLLELQSVPLQVGSELPADAEDIEWITCRDFTCM